MRLQLVRPVLFLAACLLCGAAPLRAQTHIEKLEFLSATIKMEGQSSVPGLGVRLHLTGGPLGQNGSLVPAIEFWSDADRFPEFGIEKVSQRDWTFGADARYRFDIQKSWRPYAGGGLGLHVVRSAIDPVGEPERGDTSGRLGMNVLAGVELPAAQRVQTSVEITYHIVSGYHQLKFNWGFAVKF